MHIKIFEKEQKDMTQWKKYQWMDDQSMWKTFQKGNKKDEKVDDTNIKLKSSIKKK